MGFDEDRTYAEEELRSHALEIALDKKLLERAKGVLVVLDQAVPLTMLPSRSGDATAVEAAVFSHFRAFCQSNDVPLALARWVYESARFGFWKHLPSTSVFIGGDVPTDTRHLVPVEVNLGFEEDRTQTRLLRFGTIRFGPTTTPADLKMEWERNYRKPMAGVPYSSDPRALRSVRQTLFWELLGGRGIEVGKINYRDLARAVHARLCKREEHFHPEDHRRSPKRYPLRRRSEFCTDFPLDCVRKTIRRDFRCQELIEEAQEMAREIMAGKFDMPPRGPATPGQVLE